MKLYSILTTVLGCFILMLLSRCESHEQKGDAAFEAVKAGKLLSTDSNLLSKAMIQEPKKIEVVKKSESLDPWDKFKTEIEKKISTNESAIKVLKNTPNRSAKLLRKIKNVEQDNEGLRKQIDTYNIERKFKLEKFKADMDHDVNEIGLAVKNLETHSH